MPQTERLCAATLSGAHAADVPGYDRVTTPLIVHLGVGSFARAHLACYADDLLNLGSPAMIRGVSLRSPTAEEQLAPQDGLFTVLQRETDRPPAAKVVGSITSVATGPAAAVEAIADPATELVTVTVTEKGYDLEPGDLDAAGLPVSAPAVIARGLLERPRSAAPPVVASLDNLLDNGRVLRDRVRSVVAAIAPDRLTWFDREVRFPSSVVDRIVPATTPEDLDEVAALLGLVDLAAVSAEHHRSWAIEDVPGLPPFGSVGVAVVDDIEPWQRRKLWLLNGPHSALAYAGLLAGRDTIADAATHPLVARFVDRYVDDVLEIAGLPAALDPDSFATEALRRFRNPALPHRCQQVGADGSRKIGQRLDPVVRRRAAQNLRSPRSAMIVAMWIVAVAQLPVQGQLLAPVDDPRGDELRQLAGDDDLAGLCRAALAPELPAAFVTDVVQGVKDVCTDGLDALTELV